MIGTSKYYKFDLIIIKWSQENEVHIHEIILLGQLRHQIYKNKQKEESGREEMNTLKSAIF
jgi:hypothetical protein